MPAFNLQKVFQQKFSVCLCIGAHIIYMAKHHLGNLRPAKQAFSNVGSTVQFYFILGETSLKPLNYQGSFNVPPKLKKFAMWVSRMSVPFNHPLPSRFSFKS